MRVQHPLEVHGVQEILDEGVKVHEMSVRDFLMEILEELKLLNSFMEIITDEEKEETK